MSHQCWQSSTNRLIIRNLGHQRSNNIWWIKDNLPHQLTKRIPTPLRIRYPTVYILITPLDRSSLRWGRPNMELPPTRHQQPLVPVVTGSSRHLLRLTLLTTRRKTLAIFTLVPYRTIIIRNTGRLPTIVRHLFITDIRRLARPTAPTSMPLEATPCTWWVPTAATLSTARGQLPRNTTMTLLALIHLTM